MVNVVKQASPADGTNFNFTCTGQIGSCRNQNNVPTTNFSLMDGDIQIIGFFSINDRINTIVEDVPEGWRLEDIICEVTFNPEGITFDFDSVDDGVVINCITRGSAVCTFSNVRACDVTIGKTALPDDGTVFDFTAPGSSEPEFTLTNDEEIDIKISAGEDVDVTETLLLGWRLNYVECLNADGVFISDIENGVNLACGPNGGSVECNFANTNIRNIPTMSEWGLIATALVLGMAGFYVIYRRRKSSYS